MSSSEPAIIVIFEKTQAHRGGNTSRSEAGCQNGTCPLKCFDIPVRFLLSQITSSVYRKWVITPHIGTDCRMCHVLPLTLVYIFSPGQPGRLVRLGPFCPFLERTQDRRDEVIRPYTHSTCPRERAAAEARSCSSSALCFALSEAVTSYSCTCEAHCTLITGDTGGPVTTVKDGPPCRVIVAQVLTPARAGMLTARLLDG